MHYREGVGKKDNPKKAHGALILSLGVKVLREISKETSVTEIWLKLENLYMIKSLENRLFLKQKLYTFKMSIGKPVEDHVDDFNKIILYLNHEFTEFCKKNRIVRKLTVSHNPQQNVLAETMNRIQLEIDVCCHMPKY